MELENSQQTIECDICNLNIERHHFMCHFICRHPQLLFTLYTTANQEPLTIIDDEEYDISYEIAEFDYLELSELLPYDVDITVISSENDKTLLESDDVCPICLDILMEKDNVRQMNVCKHNYCKGCIEKWVYDNKNCPMCKQDMW